MRVGRPERLQRMRAPILAQVDQHLFGRHLRNRYWDGFVGKTVSAGPEGTLRTITADGIIGSLFVWATDYSVVADRFLDPLTEQPVRHFGCDHRIVADVACVAAPRTELSATAASGSTHDRNNQLRRTCIVRTVGGDSRQRVFVTRRCGGGHVAPSTRRASV